MENNLKQIIQNGEEQSKRVAEKKFAIFKKHGKTIAMPVTSHILTHMLCMRFEQMTFHNLYFWISSRYFQVITNRLLTAIVIIHFGKSSKNKNVCTTLAAVLHFILA